MKARSSWVGALVLIGTALTGFAAESTELADYSGYAFGSWGQTRPAWAASGLFLQATLTCDLMRHQSTEPSDGEAAALGLLAFNGSLDTEDAGWWSHGQFHAQIQITSGESPTAIVGDAQVLSNIDAPGDVRLYDFWYQHEWHEGRTSLLVGLHDLNSEFYALGASALYLNSSFGVGPELTQVGPSIFPQPTLALRLRHATESGYSLQLAAYDGVPGRRDDPARTGLSLGHGDGVLSIAQFGHSGEHTQLAAAYWQSTREYEDFAGRARDNRQGGFLLAERTLFGGQAGQRTAIAFLRAGFTPGDRSALDRSFGLGVNVRGLLAARPDDQLGLALVRAENGDDFRAFDPTVAAAETVYELTYRFEALPGIAIQPDLQWVVDPGYDPARDRSLVFGVRAQVAF